MVKRKDYFKTSSCALNYLGYGNRIHMQSVVMCAEAISLGLSVVLDQLGSKNNNTNLAWAGFGNLDKIDPIM